MEINDEGKAETVLEQLMNARSALVQAKTDKQEATMRLKYSEEKLGKKRKELAESSSDSGRHREQMKEVQKEIKALEVRSLCF